MVIQQCINHKTIQQHDNITWIKQRNMTIIQQYNIITIQQDNITQPLMHTQKQHNNNITI